MIRIGTAGWNIPRTLAAEFVGDGRHLERYGAAMDVVEIDSSFHRPHRPSTYRRWADETPVAFRFAVKLPRTITHAAKLVGIAEPLTRFLDEVNGLGGKLGVLLVQLPPSLAFVADVVDRFFTDLRSLHEGSVVCEPRHATWFAPSADRLLVAHRVGRVAADPALSPAAAMPGGWLGPANDGRDATLFYRWHGAPRMYWSSYPHEWIAARAGELVRWPATADRWIIFDNTAAGAALENALALKAALGGQTRASREATPPNA